jgi:hypothetical protein
MSINKYLNNNSDTNLLKRFAFVGTTESFESKLKHLAAMSEKERWDQTDSMTNRNNSTIFYYVVHTFDRCFKQDKIVINDDESFALFNTGLMTEQGNEIYGLFDKSINYNETQANSNYWRLSKFVKENEKEYLSLNMRKPEMATYFSDFNELYFNPQFEIVINFDHIYDDNYQRLPIEMQSLEKDTASAVFNGFLGYTLKRIRRNNRIPVPQFYNDKITFLIPVKVFNTKIMVIALEKIGETYIGNTILTMGMAYNCARLLNKPESDWLVAETYE